MTRTGEPQPGATISDHSRPDGRFQEAARRVAALLAGASAPRGQSPRSERFRWPDELILREIASGARVLDLGCGSGALLERLITERQVRGQGVEIDAEAVLQCVERGVPVLQTDLDEGLRWFPDGAFDVVVLEETLQTLSNPHRMLLEMLRVGRRGIVSFPNFAHWRVVADLLTRGRMPVTDRLPDHWYDSENIHLFTLQDLLDWTEQHSVRVARGYVLTDGQIRELNAADSLETEEVLVVVERA